MAPKVLVVLTSADTITATKKPTGWYLPELAHPYDALSSKAELTIASPKGGVAPIDMGSVKAFTDPSSVAFYENKKSLWENTEKLSTFVGRSSEFDAVFYPGGHGPMFDLVDDKDSIALIAEFAAAGKVIAAVCHGSIVLANVVMPDGKHLISGKEVAGFSNEEEDKVGMTQDMPFLVEDKLKEAGGIYKKADQPWGEMVAVADGGKLITGQNPASAKAVGEAIAKSLGI